MEKSINLYLVDLLYCSSVFFSSRHRETRQVHVTRQKHFVVRGEGFSRDLPCNNDSRFSCHLKQNGGIYYTTNRIDMRKGKL